MDPKIWGPKAWFFLHSVTMGYPEKPSSKDRENYANFFNSLGHILPCEVCREHYAEHLKTNPVEKALDNKERFVFWFFNFHNIVNKSLNKPTITYKEFLNLYNDEYIGTLTKNKPEITQNPIVKNERMNFYKYMAISLFVICVVLILDRYVGVF